MAPKLHIEHEHKETREFKTYANVEEFDEDSDTSSMGATSGSEAIQDARNQSFSSIGLPRSNLNTSGSSGQSDRNDLTRFPGRAVVKYPGRKVARFLKKPATKLPGTIAGLFPSRSVASRQVQRESCRQIPKETCNQVLKESCRQVPRESCK